MNAFSALPAPLRFLSSTPLAAASLSAAMLAGTPALAIQPQRWVHTTEADFEAGEPQGVVVTNLGDLQLARRVQLLAEAPEGVSLIHALVRLGDRTLLAGGPQGELLEVQADTCRKLLTLKDEQIFALGIFQGRLLVAVSGEQSSRLATLTEENTLETLLELPEERYLWHLLVRGEVIDIATGPNGRLYRARPTLGASVQENAPTLLAEVRQPNLLCLAGSGRGDEPFYVGTDQDGIVYRVQPTTGMSGEVEIFAVYDAAEPEIGALLLASDGTLYVGTADAQQARPGRLEQSVREEKGRPESPAGGGAGRAPGPGDPPAEGPGEEKPGDAPTPEVPAPGDLPDVPPAPAPIQPEPTPAEPAEPAPAPAAEASGDGDAATALPGPVSPAPSQEQFDRLREQIRQQLLSARDSGTLSVQETPAARRSGVEASSRGPRTRPSASGSSRQGNAVYRIDPRGFVSEIFRESVMVLGLAESRDRILIATGPGGLVYQVDPATAETTVMADLDAEQVLSLSADPLNEAVWAVTAQPARLQQLDDSLAPRGVYLGPILDATHTSLWGTLQLTGHWPAGSSMTVETRSGNVTDPQLAPWSAWSQAQVFTAGEVPGSLKPREMKIASPPARFLQYRLTLTAGVPAKDSGPQLRQGPMVGRVEIAYVVPNLQPRIRSLTTSYPAGGNAPANPVTAMQINWEAEDPNGDSLRYRLEYQPAPEAPWLLIAEDLDRNSYSWETRHIPDGRYLLRLTADDRMDNPGDMALTAARISDPVLVDNTAPVFENLSIRPTPRPGGLQLNGTASDALSPITRIAYRIGGDDASFTPILPDDLIFDSTRESWSVTLSDLAPGPVVVTLRATDARGNTVYHNMLATVQAP